MQWYHFVHSHHKTGPLRALVGREVNDAARHIVTTSSSQAWWARSDKSSRKC